jgi:hypothetical protein
MSRAIALLAALLTVACLDTPTSPDAVIGTPFDLRAGATASLPDGLKITFETVRSDSRCPMDVMCVWAGEAIVAVSVKAATGGPETRELSTTPSGSAITYAGYTISMTALAPYPRASQQIRPGDYVTTLVVTTR